MKEGRIEGSVNGEKYVISGPQGLIREIPLEEARQDRKLAAAIQRNSWEEIDGSQ